MEKKLFSPARIGPKEKRIEGRAPRTLAFSYFMHSVHNFSSVTQLSSVRVMLNEAANHVVGNFTQTACLPGGMAFLHSAHLRQGCGSASACCALERRTLVNRIRIASRGV
jgi:hypothetical protein